MYWQKAKTYIFTMKTMEKITTFCWNTESLGLRTQFQLHLYLELQLQQVHQMTCRWKFMVNGLSILIYVSVPVQLETCNRIEMCVCVSVIILLHFLLFTGTDRLPKLKPMIFSTTVLLCTYCLAKRHFAHVWPLRHVMVGSAPQHLNYSNVIHPY